MKTKNNAPHVILNAVKDLPGYGSMMRSFAPLRMTGVMLLTTGVMLLMAVLLAACSNDDQASGTDTTTVAASIGNITIATPTATRAATAAEVITAFTGTETINLTYYQGSKEITETHTVDELKPGPTLYINAAGAAKNTVEATYLPADDGGVYADHLACIAAPGNGIDYLADGTAKITLAFKHLRGLVKLGTVSSATPPSSGTSTLAVDENEPITITYLAPNEAEASVDAKELILPHGTVVTSVAFTLTNGMAYTAEPHNSSGTAPTAEAGKILTINITIDGQTATIDTTTPHDIAEWEAEEVGHTVPDGYDRAIYTEADLVAFRDATNSDNDETRIAACGAKVIQMADITMTEEWSRPIASGGTDFSGTYDGNGFTITGLKVNNPNGAAALFFTVDGATLTGIHLREVEITGDYAAALAIVAQNSSTISLCSATGQVTGSINAGGLVTGLLSDCTLVRSRANCAVTADGGENDYAGGLVGINSGTILGCMAGGSVGGEAGFKGGLVGSNNGAAIYYSYTTTAGVGLIGNTYSGSTYIKCSYCEGKAYDVDGGEVDMATAQYTAGYYVRGESESDVTFAAGGIDYLANEIWTEGDRPTLKYGYEGE